jgi:hypothetical protein
VRETRSLDVRRRLLEQQVFRGEQLRLNRSQRFDPVGEVTERVERSPETARFLYDPIERLRWAAYESRGIEDFVIDESGQLLTRGGHRFRYRL